LRKDCFAYKKQEKLFENAGQHTSEGGGQKAELLMRLLMPTDSGRGSEGQISHEAIKADRIYLQ